MTIPSIVDFRDPVATEETAPAREKVLTGAPRTQVSNHYADAGSRFFAGTWASTTGKWRVSYTEHEFCHLLEGRVTITSDDGREWRFGPGDTWVIPAGFSGIWETVEPARKRYAMYEAGGG